MEIYFLLTFVHFSSCNWEAEWLAPIRETYSKETSRNTPDDFDLKIFNDELRMTPMYEDANQPGRLKYRDIPYGVMSGEAMSARLTERLKDTLQNARALAETLKSEIIATGSREKMLKEIIVNGRSGVTVLSVLLAEREPRTYIIRDGFWTLCNGMVQFPKQGSSNIFNELFAAPRCIGQEVTSRQDPCVFNSVVKYEIIPKQRGIIYTEDDYLCLKSNFNQTLEQYLSVPRYVVNETCVEGTVRRLADNSAQCGTRVLSEYTYYPHKSSASRYLPLEYCSESDGACKLIVAWHISNSSVENFEYIKNDKAFKKFFMNMDRSVTKFI